MKSLSFATLFAALSGFVVLWVASWSLDAETQMPLFQACLLYTSDAADE